MIRIISVVAHCFIAGGAIAQTTHGAGHSANTNDEASAAYMAAMDDMNMGMNTAMTGDPDIDFVLMMIPHHEGAVKMAKVALDHATDPQVRALAEAVIAAQSDELNLMRAWLTAKGL